MRDLMTVRVWDLAMTRAPVRVIDVADSLRPRLSELWETERIFDRFEIAVVRATALHLISHLLGTMTDLDVLRCLCSCVSMVVVSLSVNVRSDAERRRVCNGIIRQHDDGSRCRRSEPWVV